MKGTVTTVSKPAQAVSRNAVPDLSPTLQALIDTQANPFVLIDETYRIVAANKAYLSNYGADAAQIVGHQCHQISHHRDSPCWQNGEECPHRQVFQTLQSSQVLHTHYDNLGRPEHVRITGHLIPKPDGGFLMGESISRMAEPMDLDCEKIRMIGQSPALLQAIDRLKRAASSNANVLLYGESGVGKELAAHFIHDQSVRKSGPFMTVDCAALSESLFESEIFGHERGAFTGCVGLKRGLFELCNGGTLFLDEIGELPPMGQAKLLRVIETGEFRRVGGREMLSANVRVVAASHRRLRSMVEQGTFREDLYYRLACIAVDLPPLRERRSDIPALSEALVSHINQANQTHCYLTGAALDKLSHHDFPGNIRELRNILQRALVMCNNSSGAISADEIVLEHAHDWGATQHKCVSHPSSPVSASAISPATDELPPNIHQIESRYTKELLDRYHGQRRLVAQALGISERTLYRKLKRYNLE